MSFATCLNCIDGRTQLPVIEWIRKHHGCSYVDMITEPGLVESLSGGLESLKPLITKINISLDKHSSQKVFVVGHHDCAACGRGEFAQKEILRQAAQHLAARFPSCLVQALWVDEYWRVRKLPPGPEKG